ncbi:MAG: Bifunctional glutamine synthetase adenylyltransferase/adenylyl-removing enzyme [Calditrichaeota bacterium]|nr:Bifunctional glutamine synthetase adenylyltransferase/adenylyl-removing enzyme [Calditrichota bacterium]
MAANRTHERWSFLDDRLAGYPDPGARARRLEVLAGVPGEAAESIAGDETLHDAFAALVVAGDAPVRIAARFGADLPIMLSAAAADDELEFTAAGESELLPARERAWLAIALREQLAVWPVERSARAYSELADSLSRSSLRAVSDDPSGLLLFALGKWGGCELNPASDIDPVFFTAGGAEAGRADRDVRAWVQRMSGTRDRPGYDVDLRLRPEGDSGPLAWTLPAAERYFLQRAAPWERVAWLRARVVAGDPPGWFRELLAHFLFAMGGDVKQLAGDVTRALAGVHANAHPRNIKRTPGGIRDVEFLVASFQLSEGREHTSLRRGSIAELIRRLAQVRRIERDAADSLLDNYLFLRRVEHALQVEEGRAQFVVPEPDTAGHARLAYALALSPRELERSFRSRRAAIRELARSLLPSEDEAAVFAGLTAPDPQPDARGDERDRLAKTARARAVLTRLSGRWGPATALFDARELAGTADSEHALARLEQSVLAYGGPQAWFAAFAERPQLRREITRLIRDGRRVVEEAIKRPYLWEKIGAKTFPPPESGDRETLDSELGDFMFHLGEAFLAGAIDAEELTGTWSRAVDRVARIVARDTLAGGRGTAPVALLASGKWGGGELAPDGDLDLMFVCADGPSDRVAAAVQRSTEFLRALSLNGRLTPDARLRPEGSGAPLCVTVSRLGDYLASRAAPWERMALVRARLIAGDEAAGGRAQRALRRFSTTPPRADELPVLHFARRKASDASRPRRGVYRIKKARGGMMDFEFAATFAGWRLRLPADERWSAPLCERFRRLADVDREHMELWAEAGPAYGELRRWELVQVFSSAHRRGEVPAEGEDAQRFAEAAGLSVDEVRVRWREISALGRELYERTAAMLKRSPKN